MSDVGRSPGPDDFNIGHVLTVTFRIFFRHVVPITFVTVLSFAAVGTLAVAAMWALGRDGLESMTNSPPGGAYNIVGIVTIVAGMLSFWILAYAVATAGVVVGVFDSLSGRGVRFGKMIQVCARAAPRVFVVQLIAILFTMIGLVLLVVPGVIVSLMLFVAIPVSAVEGRWVTALGRSTDLTRDNLFALFGLGVVLFILSIVFSFIINLFQTAVLTNWAVGSNEQLVANYAIQGVYYVVSTAFPAVAAAVAYFELRRIKEGVGAEQLADVFA